MAFKAILEDHDFQKLGIVKDARLNPLSSSARTTLAGTLGAGHVGLVTTDDVTGYLYTWNGTAFVLATPVQQSGLTPKGNAAFNATEPSSPTLGDLYVFSSAGTNTWEGSNVVQVGDQAYWDGTVWQFIQGNVIQATETIAGIGEVATQAETNSGSSDAVLVTPQKLASWASTKGFGKVYFIAGVTTVANTPLTINHALNLQHRDAYKMRDRKSVV